MNAINPTIDEVSERTQEYVDAWFNDEEPTETEDAKTIKKLDPELEKIILQFSRWYGNEPWLKTTMKHDDILKMAYVDVPSLTVHSIEYLTCGHSYGITPISNNCVRLYIQWNQWR